MLKKLICILPAILAGIVVMAQETEPYKPDNEFEFKFDYSFKERLRPEKSDYEAPDPGKKTVTTGPLPYLKTEVKVLRLGTGEVRLKVLNHKGTTVINRKASTDFVVKIDWGYSDDVKDQIVSHKYSVLFLNEEKEILSRIILEANPDGTFFVNGQKKGRL
ncbi:MAG TPA: hypothetical protein PLM56_17385 [Cyclobacteriaceae bacterium]|jgi:hypothetical protein|nr:hypothetical protein [Cytophagales bacterium]HNT51251.1 hypothetical protein [Cyclobacteriaceae bacterium]HRE67200.1 hypothetical protein [Cyclobacteriaceae bacterium]HRF35282.1 hypothetical protein [Cyclobacteriaceae bacterium]